MDATMRALVDIPGFLRFLAAIDGHRDHEDIELEDLGFCNFDFVNDVLERFGVVDLIFEFEAEIQALGGWRAEL